MTRVAVVALGVVAMMISLVPAALAATETVYYYPDDDGWPSASLKASSPTNTGPMPDIDSNGKQGRRVDKSDKGLGETDPKHYHQWSTPADGLEITGSAALTIWFADKSFDDGDVNRLVAYLLDCGSSSCTTLASTFKDVTPPDGENVFSQTTLNFPALSEPHEFASGRSLRVRIIVDKDFSDDDMTFAYDTTAYPTRLKLTKVVPPPTTTTTTTTTSTTSTSTTTSTTTPTTTTTTTPKVTTTTEPTPTTTTDSTTSTTDSTTTSGPDTTTTTIPTTSTTTGATPTTTAAAGTATPTTTLPPPAELDTEKTNLVIKTTPEQRGVLVSTDSVEMTPVEGLMVTFVSAAETVRTNLLSSVGLGLIMASLLVIGMSRRSAEDQPEG